MKKLTLLLLLLLVALALAGCSAIQSSGLSDNEALSGAGAQVASGTLIPGEDGFQMPAVMKLALGMVRLDESSYPISAQQAQAQLPLWKAYRSLNNSDTAAAAELEGLIKQIQGTLNAEQVDAIDDMNLSMGDMPAVAEILGIEAGFGGPGQMDDEQRSAFRATAEAGGQMGPGGGGGFPLDGGAPGGGPPGGMEGGFDPQARQTALASGAVSGRGIGLNTEFLNALIKFLEAKAQQ